MEERKLNLNARFLSVRRIATTPVCTDGEKEKIIQRPDGRHTLPPYKSDFCLEQVTEPVAVPFHWEHIPGKAKEDKEPETQPREETSVTPRLPPGKPIDYVTKQTLEKDHADRNGIRPQFKSYSSNENVMDLKCSKEKTNERRALEVEDEDDVYSDALETISPTESFSFNCSASGLSQSDGADVKQSRAFSVDLQTRDLMMSRFLPAAKAMALETPHYAAKKQYIAPEQPRQVTRVIREDIRPLPNEQGSHMELQYDQYKEEEESEGEDDEYDPSGSISAKGCGLFPRLCLRNSLCLLSPVPGMKGRTRALMSSSSGVIRPEKTTYGRSHSQPLNKHALDAAYKHKSKGGIKSGELHKFDNKKAGESSRFSHSGDLKKGRSSPLRHSRSACISPYRNEAPSGVKSGELQKFEYKQAGESSLFTRSGDLKKGRLSPLRHSRSACISPYRNEAPSGVKSAELQKLEYKQAGESRRFSHSGDLKNGRSSTFSNSRSACVSPYRNEAPCGVKSGELQKFEYKQAGESNRFSYSGDLKKGRSSTFSNSRSACISPYRNEAPCGVKSGELQKSEYKQAGASSCLSHSGDFKNGRSSPFRHSRSACISPYRNEAPKSPFPGVGFLGIPREESVKANSGAPSTVLIPMRFVWPYGGRSVFLSGSFARWSELIPMTPVEGCPTVFQAIYSVTPGYHQYKFFVDGEWRHDEHQPYVSGEYGLVNTVLLATDPNFFHPNVTPEITSGSNMEEDTEAFRRLVRITDGNLTDVVPRITEGDLQGSRHRISVFLSAHTTYELLPESGKVVALDVDLPVKQAFHILHEQGIPLAPLWDFSKGQFVGVLTASDFILILRELGNHGSNLTEEELETHTIAAWKEGKAYLNGQIDGHGRALPRRFIHAGPYDNMKDVVLKLLQNEVATVPIIHSSSEDGTFPQLLHLASLSGILKCICRYFRHSSSSLPILQAPIGELHVGTWVPEIGESNCRPLAMLRPSASLSAALNLLVQAQVSSIPIVDDNDSLVDIYCRSDITALAKDRAYAHINLNEMTIHQALQLGQDSYSPFEPRSQRCQMCLRSDSLHKVMERLANPGVRRLVIVEAGSKRVEGIVSLSDIFKFLLG